MKFVLVPLTIAVCLSHASGGAAQSVVITPAPSDAAGQSPCQYQLTSAPSDKSKYLHKSPPVISAPWALQAPDSKYPRDIGNGPRQGTVVLEVGIGETGDVEYASVTQSVSCSMDQAALEAIRKWHFAPAKQNGKRIPVKATIQVKMLPQS